MTEVENVKRKAETLSLQSPRLNKYVKMEDIQESNKTTPTSVNGMDALSTVTPTPTTTTSTSCDTARGNITIIHTQANGKHGGSRMQWTFPRAYLAGRIRATSPSTPDKTDAELNTANINGSFTPDAIAVFYQAITTESSVPSYGHSLHEYCQIYALAQFFGVHNIFQDGETALLRRSMGEETSLDTIRTASSLASIFRWRALVERCRLLLCRRINQLESDLKNMNCGGLNVLATKLDEVYDFLAKTGFLQNSSETRKEPPVK
jgi:hypothetical protein